MTLNDRCLLFDREFDNVSIDQSQGPDSGGSQIQGRWSAQSAHSDQGHPCRFQPLLARSPNLPEHQVTGISFDLTGVECHCLDLLPLPLQMPVMQHNRFPDWHGTTILGVRKNGITVIAGDGQVSMGQTVVKGNARKVRTLAGGKVLAGFAGATADAFTLIERLETKLEQHPEQLARACVDLAKDWRTDRYLRKLEAMLIVADSKGIYTVTGVGDVLEPETAVAAIGSGGNYALAAALALMDSELDAESIARRAMEIAARICVYTNGNLTLERLEA